MNKCKKIELIIGKMKNGDITLKETEVDKLIDLAFKEKHITTEEFEKLNVLKMK